MLISPGDGGGEGPPKIGVLVTRAGQLQRMANRCRRVLCGPNVNGFQPGRSAIGCRECALVAQELSREVAGVYKGKPG